MLIKLIVTSLKQAKRDPMYLFFLIYPIILSVVALFLNDYLESLQPIIIQIVQTIFILMNGFIFGALTGFSLLDDKDDYVLMSLKVTPMKLSTYVTYKIVISIIFSMFATLITLLSLKLYSINLFDFAYIIFLSGLQAPIITLIITVFSRNKVEGFVIMKSTGLLLIAPIISLFVFDIKELLLYFFPGFYPIRILSMNQLSKNFVFSHTYIYMLIGTLISIILTVILYNRYIHKLKNIF